MDPSAAVKEVAAELEKQAKECRVDTVDQVLDKIEEIMNKAKAGPGDMIEKLAAAFEEFNGKIEKAINDPAALSNAGGPMVACASWYATEVAGKLKELVAEVTEISKVVHDKVAEAAKPLSQVATALEEAMKGMEGSAKKLAKLPKEVQDLATTIKGPADLAKVDMGPISGCLDLSPLTGSLTKIDGLKSVLGPVISAVSATLAGVAEFLMSLAEKLIGAFQVPSPLCFLTPMVMSQAPPLLAELLEKVKALQKIDVQPVVEGMKMISDTIGNFDAKAVSVPLEKLAVDAKASIGKLDEAVSAAKLSTKNPMGRMFGK
ncbi:unnamed protein product [Polarella glacialis]|uniref:Uncharacterized protein n=1 Tax=Polarella glacialis TaxID=89957 RepID=A0A813HV73_POLGL|nr:unnamed protein product [Polarella glacialis]CAE8684921.1 unnamed protein product [Polarella glacialis]